MGLRHSLRTMVHHALAACLVAASSLHGWGYAADPSPAPAPERDPRVFVTDDSFDFRKLVEESKKPVVVEFYAASCGPCRLMQYQMREFANDHAGKVDIYRIDSDKCPKLAAQQQVTHIPTYLVYAHGRLVSRETGFLPKQRLEKAISSAGPDR